MFPKTRMIRNILQRCRFLKFWKKIVTKALKEEDKTPLCRNSVKKNRKGK